MQQLEMEYFDLYKRVDQICADMLGTVYGVTDYITALDAYLPYSDLALKAQKNLKHLRWVRSCIAHESGVSPCVPGDLDRLQLFYQQLLSQTDPLTRLYRSSLQGQESAPAPREPAPVSQAQSAAEQNLTPAMLRDKLNEDMLPEKETPKNNMMLWIALVAAGIVGAVGALLLLLQ